MDKILSSELILNGDGSVYHLGLLPEDIADTIVLVGDQERVRLISEKFDKIEIQKKNREFISHTGWYKDKRITVMSTGIGTDNIDIVLNELDALCSFDLESKTLKKNKRKLNLVRLGTSGSLQAGNKAGSFILSKYSLGFDGMLRFYQDIERVNEHELVSSFRKEMEWPDSFPGVYGIHAGCKLYEHFKNHFEEGITISAPGFYGPQGRVLRLDLKKPSINEELTSFRYGDFKITNYEMESSALYGLSKMLGHEALTVCALIANRVNGDYVGDYHGLIHELIDKTLELIIDFN